MGLFDSQTDNGGYSEGEEIRRKRGEKVKGAEELISAGRAAAGKAAADKAAEAGKAARAQMLAGNTSKLQAASQGAGASSEAATKGYAEASAEAAANEQKKEEALNALAESQAQAKEKEEEGRREREAARKNAWTTGILSAIGGIFSDKNAKNFKKHTYISKEER